MATLTLQDAEGLADRGRPWTFRMEYRLPQAPASVPGEYILVTGRAKHQPIEIHMGKVGASKPTLIQTKNWKHVEQVVADKLSKGWWFADTPFVPVRRQTINAYKASQGQAPLPTPATPAPAQPAPVQPAPAPQPSAVVNGIAWVKPLTTGGFKALDASGNEIRDLTLAEAQNLVQRHKVAVRWA